MRNELIAKSENLLRVTLERSAETSLKTYKKVVYDEDGEGPGGYNRLQAKWKTSFDHQQVSLYILNFSYFSLKLYLFIYFIVCSFQSSSCLARSNCKRGRREHWVSNMNTIHFSPHSSNLSTYLF